MTRPAGSAASRSAFLGLAAAIDERVESAENKPQPCCWHYDGPPSHTVAECCMEWSPRPCPLVTDQQLADHDAWWSLLWLEAPYVG